ncbi:MAG: hypothetical protein J6Y37_11500 [Paludibacteraceae bacterium]|nr:hypothetical protein [Paludibacteraceae bacterium]
MRERLNEEILRKIRKISKNYKYCGFWKKGQCTFENEEINPTVYFNDEATSLSYMMNAFNNLTDEDYEARIVDSLVYYHDGDEITELPKSVDGSNVTINYDYADGRTCIYFTCKDYETEDKISARLFGKVVEEARRQYVKDVFGTPAEDGMTLEAKKTIDWLCESYGSKFDVERRNDGVWHLKCLDKNYPINLWVNDKGHVGDANITNN